MAFTEDPSVFLADFGQDCTLAGVPVRAIFDNNAVLEVDMLTEGPSVLLASTDAASAAAGQAFFYGGVGHVVRQVLKDPLDGVFTRLVLARS